MNNSKIWLVVKPTVGIPLFLSAVAVGSFAVHVAVLSNTTWVSDFLSGQPLGSGEETAMLPQEDGEATARASFVSASTTSSGDRILVEMPDGTLAVATVEAPAVLASASEAAPPPEH
ncbi:light-harvesting protein [Ruegeria profundi]|uniref:light-harvesting protein n=1 Tax=Ruegeria profundi TaxID=1685378 RepID=UPI003C7E6EB7